MKRIAILTCLDACKVCAGASCLSAWNRRERGFAPYAADTGMLEKLDRLQNMGVDTVHIGVCAVKERETGTLCPTIAKIRDLLHARGMKTIVGTH